MGVLGNGATRPVVRKKAALCLLRLLRKAPPDTAEVMQPEVWGVKLAAMLEERDLGVLLGLSTLLLGVASRSYEGEADLRGWGRGAKGAWCRARGAWCRRDAGAGAAALPAQLPAS